VNLSDLSEHDVARVRELEKVRDGLQTPYECLRRLRIITSAEIRAEQAEIRKLGDALRQRHRRDRLRPEQREGA